MNNIPIRDLSLFYIYYALINGIQMTHLKLQKLLYYIQAYHLVYFDKANIFNDVPEAWVNGHVYRAIYEIYKYLGTNRVINYNEDADGKIEIRFSELKENLELKLTKEQVKFIYSIYNKFGLMTPERLVFLTHSEPPWNNARKGLGPFDYSDNKITFESMYIYYSKVLNKKKS